MKLYKYAPEKIKTVDDLEVNNPFKGYVEIQIPTYKERLDIVKGLDFDDKKQNGADAGKKVIDLVIKHVKSVSLQYGEEKITDLDELSYYKEGTELINGISAIIIQGIPLGNGSKPL